MTEQDDYLVDAILCHKELAEQGEALALAEDGIRIALKTAGYENVDSMTQFERASALLNMAQEYIAIKPYADATYLTDYVKDNYKSLAHY